LLALRSGWVLLGSPTVTVGVLCAFFVHPSVVEQTRDDSKAYIAQCGVFSRVEWGVTCVGGWTDAFFAHERFVCAPAGHLPSGPAGVWKRSSESGW
jgi:hypothetical protein